MFKVEFYSPKQNELQFTYDGLLYSRVLHKDSKGFYVNFDNDKVRLDKKMLPKSVHEPYYIVKSSKTYREGLEEITEDFRPYELYDCTKDLYEHCLANGYKAWAIWGETRFANYEDLGYKGKTYTVFFYK